MRTIHPTGIEERWLESGNGKKIYTLISRPLSPSSSEKGLPAIVVVPGGLGGGTPYLQDPFFSELAAEGHTIVAFNPQGRGSGEEGDLRSEGREDYNGFIHQEDLKRVLEETAQLAGMEGGMIGILSFSFGVSMAAGYLGRHGGPGVRFLIDVEGPSDNYVILARPWLLRLDIGEARVQEISTIFGHPGTEHDRSSENARWWAEREAVRYIGHLETAYMRIQAHWDHVQPPSREYTEGFDRPPRWYPNKHAVDMLNAATRGRSPWTRMNTTGLGNPVNTLYSREYQPEYFEGDFDFSSPRFRSIIREAISECSDVEI